MNTYLCIRWQAPQVSYRSTVIFYAMMCILRWKKMSAKNQWKFRGIYKFGIKAYMQVWLKRRPYLALMVCAVQKAAAKTKSQHHYVINSFLKNRGQILFWNNVFIVVYIHREGVYPNIPNCLKIRLQSKHGFGQSVLCANTSLIST